MDWHLYSDVVIYMAVLMTIIMLSMGAGYLIRWSTELRPPKGKEKL